MEQKEYVPKCTCGEQISGICNGLGKCPVYPPKPYNSLEEALKIDLQKKTDALKSELPQEIVGEISNRSEKGTDHMGPIGREIVISDRRSGYTIGAKIASEHYEPKLKQKEEDLRLIALKVISQAAQIQSKDAEITALKEELERVKKQLSDATSMLNTQ